MNELVGLIGGLGLLLPVLAALVVLLYLVPIPLWIAAWASGAYVGLLTLIGMRLRRVPPTTVVTARISAVKAGLDIALNDLEAHFLAGGNVVRVVNAMISADKANIPLPFKRAAAIDLAGRNVLEAVQMSVLPKVIETPKIAAVAKDGIQLIAVCRVTVRTNIDRLVGGAGEETIIARVGEGMVSTIGSASSHKNVLENPDHISKHVLTKGLDAGTAYEILSIDIADVDVGQHRRQAADRPGQRRQADRPGQGRGAPRDGGGAGAGDAGARRRGRGRSAARDGRCVPPGQHGHHGLLPHEEPAGRHGMRDEIAGAGDKADGNPPA